MDFAVLIKVVPDVEKMRYDPDRKTMIREGSELFINPFDQRAVRVALDARRPGELVTVVSMGPPSAEAALQETLALGADRAVLLTDRQLAGSDTLVTARALVKVLTRVGHDVVLTGTWTTDSETGQVGPEVAGLLGVTFVGGARKLERAPQADGWVITTDTPSGWIRLRARAPLVISVSEKITKIRKPSQAEMAASRSKSVERLSAADVGLDPETIGLSGSPTVVVTLTNEEPTRTPVIISNGTTAERVDRAVEVVERLLRAETTLAPLTPGRSSSGENAEEILVLVSGPDGHTDPVALHFLAEIRRALPKFAPSAVWIGANPNDLDRRQAQRSGAERGFHVPVSSDFVASRVAAAGFGRLLERRPQAAGAVFSADPFGREVAGQVAAQRGLGLTGDAVGMKAGEDGSLRWLKPAFGGGIIAEIFSRTQPSLVTMRPGSFVPDQSTPGGTFDVERVEAGLPDGEIEFLDRGVERDPRWGDLETARAVVSVGMGLGGPEQIETVRARLEGTPFALAATRRVVDAGWVPRQLQVGLTGRSLGPELVVFAGVGGAGNHLVGWRRARIMVAVNSDPKAPIFAHVDVGLVGRWEDILPPLLGALSGRFPASSGGTTP